GAYALREDAHVRVDVVYLLFPDRAKAITNVITSFFFFLFAGALLWTGITFAKDSTAVWEVSFTEWAIQYWPVKWTIALGALLLLLQGFAILVRDITFLSGRRA
ncbi:MAG: TRAP transporter small permease subunit, partial [Gammaproteobacteria bacterium]|nr:TRAP transporter small permease subunit [Gammaproteobacteria bacterium]NIR97353.1 TRAP transporter small permease subunit [Gammaproteobacteria bacterium]NIT63012.1 TRAP transporter small permease subunit [Gammaproteobacteria bacterium]NIV19973.1 TRAP transporter small permease subunit [Gammaproteobacteria bacterium]NIY31592.1 TRAP transporter small permease subunit [Gammaproteobacteria bacterium]